MTNLTDKLKEVESKWNEKSSEFSLGKFITQRILRRTVPVNIYFTEESIQTRPLEEIISVLDIMQKTFQKDFRVTPQYKFRCMDSTAPSLYDLMDEEVKPIKDEVKELEKKREAWYKEVEELTKSTKTYKQKLKLTLVLKKLSTANASLKIQKNKLMITECTNKLLGFVSGPTEKAVRAHNISLNKNSKNKKQIHIVIYEQNEEYKKIRSAMGEPITVGAALMNGNCCTVNDSKSLDYQELAKTIMREIGHLLGAYHSDDKKSAMYPAIQPSTNIKWDLTSRYSIFKGLQKYIQ